MSRFLILGIHIAVVTSQLYQYNSLAPRQGTNSTSECPGADQNLPPPDLTQCRNQTLFFVWRPKARFIAPEGWMNDPMAMFQRSDGSFHAGYQAHPQHVQWGNISQASAFSEDLVFWRDAGSWEDAKTLYPSQIYDIRGVFDGSIIKNGWDGNPTMIYTSTFTGPLGSSANPPEQQGAETQSIAYTTDDGKSWTKLRFGAGGNPVIYAWPETNLTGFRDPYAFTSSVLTSLLGNSSSNNASGEYFLTISGGQRDLGARLFLYRQANSGDAVNWEYLGPVLSVGVGESWSEWSGNFGRNFETAFVSRLTTTGRATEEDDPDAVDVIGFGTELGRNGSHEDHWPLWSAVNYTANENGSITADILYSGVADWGRAYAFTSFPVGENRDVLVGWTYEDDENLVLTKQRGYQGAFTLFRDLFIKHISNVDPSTPGLHDKGSWGVRTETDGSTTVITVGQKVVPEINEAYRSSSNMSELEDRVLESGYTPFEVQLTGAYYAVTARFEFDGEGGQAGFRVRASKGEWTDVVYDLGEETVYVLRNRSSLIESYGTETEAGKLRLWPILSSSSNESTAAKREPLNMTVYVDNSVLEIYANDVFVLTTRIYPWLANSTGAGFISSGNGSVNVTSAEVWDGLVDVWPDRPVDTRRGLVWDGPANDVWGLWAGW